MIEKIVSGISLALSSEYPEFSIYADSKVSQGLEPPCFFIGLGEWSAAPLPCGLYRARLPVDVVYFPENEDDYQEMWSVGPQVLEVIEKLTLPDGDCVRGTGMRCATADGLMHIQATYMLRLSRAEEREIMEKLTIKMNFDL